MPKILEIGDLVLSISGHDVGEYYVVMAVDGEYTLCVNGKNKTKSNPKRKNSKHLAYVKSLNSIAENLKSNSFYDFEITTVLNQFKKSRRENV